MLYNSRTVHDINCLPKEKNNLIMTIFCFFQCIADHDEFLQFEVKQQHEIG